MAQKCFQYFILACCHSTQDDCKKFTTVDSLTFSFWFVWLKDCPCDKCDCTGHLCKVTICANKNVILLILKHLLMAVVMTSLRSRRFWIKLNTIHIRNTGTRTAEQQKRPVTTLFNFWFDYFQKFMFPQSYLEAGVEDMWQPCYLWLYCPMDMTQIKVKYNTVTYCII